jgi:hypothetical protein
MILLILLLATITAGCSTANHYDTRPFFLQEQDAAKHGRKNWFDHVVEVDPGRARFKVEADYDADPPERIAVLPFVDYGTGQYHVDKIPLSFRNRKERQEWAWTYANRVRRSFTGEIAEREFTIVPIPLVDAALQAHGIDNWAKLKTVPPEVLGRWLGADTVVYGEVLHYDAYYAFLISSWQVAMDVQMVSTRDGHQIFSASDGRYSVNLSPAIDLMDIGINSVLSLLQLRDVTLARAEYEVSREIAIRIPTSYRALTHLQIAAMERNGANKGWVDQGAGIVAASAPARISPATPHVWQYPSAVGKQRPFTLIADPPNPVN